MQNILKIHTFIIGTALLIMSCGNISKKVFNQDSPIDSINMEDIKYKIIITNYYFGRVMHETTVTNDSLIVKRDQMTGNRSSESRTLTEKECDMMKEFLFDFPLEELKKQYIAEAVQDGTVINFSITINKRHKEIYISNIFQKDLGALVKVVVKLLKEDYIGYNLNSVPLKDEN